MELHYLEIFNTVARVQNYRKSSDELHISQPALSIEIKKLEEQIGLQLFDRIGTRIYLNDNGRMLQKYTERIFSVVSDMEGAIQETKSHVGGVIRIGASNTPGTYILPELMARFRRRYPDVSFNMTIGSTSEIARRIEAAGLDIAVNGGECEFGKQIHTEKIYEDRLVLVSSAHSPAAKLESLDRTQLMKLSFVVHKTDSQLYADYRSFIGRLDIPEKVAMSVGNIDAIKNSVKTDIGISLVPEAAVKEEIQKGELKVLTVPGLEIEYPYRLLYNNNRSLSLATVKFIEYMRCLYAKSRQMEQQVDVM